MKTDLLTILTIALCCCGGDLTATESPFPDPKFTSPNGRYVVGLVTVDREQHFQITDLKAKRVNDSIIMPTILLYLHWAANSQSFVTVEHEAEGSHGRVVFLRSGTWNSCEVMPPNNSMMRYTVVDSKLGRGRVHFSFCVARRRERSFEYDYAFYNVDVDLRTGRILEATWIPISQAKCLARLKETPSYLPPMTSR